MHTIYHLRGNSNVLLSRNRVEILENWKRLISGSEIALDKLMSTRYSGCFRSTMLFPPYGGRSNERENSYRAAE